MGGEDEIIHTKFQIQGKASHHTIDQKQFCSNQKVITGMSIISHKYGLEGKIDIYYLETKTLIERKHLLTTIYQGQIYQLWAQYFSMLEMGYPVEKLEFHSISTNTKYPLELPQEKEILAFEMFLQEFRNFNPEIKIAQNPNKCKHCIYISLCDKTFLENVYE